MGAGARWHQRGDGAERWGAGGARPWIWGGQGSNRDGVVLDEGGLSPPPTPQQGVVMLTVGSECAQQADGQAAAGPHVQHAGGRPQLHQGGEAPQHRQGHSRWLCVEKEQCFLQGILQATNTSEETPSIPPPTPCRPVPGPLCSRCLLTCPRAGAPVPRSRGYLCRTAGSQLLSRCCRKPSAQSAPAA